MEKFKWELPIGDWSSDGHSICEYFLIESNKSLEECRELYLTTRERLNAGLEGHSYESHGPGPCVDYEDSSLEIEQVERLGLNPDNYKDWIDTGDVEAEQFVALFIDYMMTHNPGLELKVIPSEPKQMFPFYGFDEKKRHIGHFGYGLFYA